MAEMFHNSFLLIRHHLNFYLNLIFTGVPLRNMQKYPVGPGSIPEYASRLLTRSRVVLVEVGSEI